MTQEVGLPDGRRAAVECCGAPAGMPVFLLHGTPGSRSGPRPRAGVLYRLGIKLISYDRPGYGGSSPHSGRAVASAAADVRAIADALDLDTFSVVGRSGGGPHALACAALLRDRIRSAAVLVGLAPSNAEDLDWYAGMSESNVEEYSAADEDPVALRSMVTLHVKRIRDDPESLLRFLVPSLTNGDKRVVSDVAMRRLLAASYAEAVRDSPEGWIDDVVALRRPWGVNLSRVEAPVLLWHGADDMFSPVAQTRWLAKEIPGATLKIQPGAAHFEAVEILPSVLTWMKGRHRSEGLRVQRVHQPALSP